MAAAESEKQGRIPDALRIFQDSEVQRDILLYFVLPSIALMAIYALPRSEQLLEFEARNPTLVGILGSNLAHRSLSHISNNIAGYWLLGGGAYILTERTKSAHIYRYAFIAYLVILPFVASWTVIRIFSNHPEILAEYESVGFSQTVGAVTGFLPIAIASYYSKLIRGNVIWTADVMWSTIGLFGLGISVAFYNLGQLNNSILVVAGMAVFVLIYVGHRLTQQLDFLADRRVFYFIFSVLLFLIGIQSLFPSSAPAGIYAHMAGYVWGFLLPLAGITGAEIFRRIRASMD
ncbi:hypothetical protein [Haloarchaeobius baliensis]|uniref:hypothetical protein n=1 Tax=Haloarchaeobius baliensis TaxID=1670458 RepID=UPI003F885227